MKKLIIIITTYKDTIERFMPADKDWTETAIVNQFDQLLKAEYFAMLPNEWEPSTLMIKSQDVRRIAFREWKDV